MGGGVNMFSFETLAIFFQKGGTFMYPIGAVGTFAAAMVIHRYLKLNLYNINSGNFMDKILKLIESNNIDRALKLCMSKRGSALPQVIVAGLNKSGKPLEDIQNAMDEATLKVVPKVQAGLGYLAMFANVATLLGLLGTISGLIAAFSAVSAADPSQKQQILASGISEAMYTTEFGLMVAIPCMMLYSHISSKATKITDDIERYSLALVNTLSDRYRALRRNVPGAPGAN